MRGSHPDRMVVLYDTTLRDGEQTPGVAFDLRQRIDIAQALDRLGIAQIEIGFAASGSGCQADMRELVGLGLNAELLSLARPAPGDIDAAIEVGVDGLVLFISTSEVHLEHKLRMPFEAVLEKVDTAVRYARSAGVSVQMTAEDAVRSDLDRIQSFARVAAEAGADRIGLADTVGRATPAWMAALVRAVREVTDVPVSVHCHDDFGLAVANSLAAVEAGARAVSVTVNGIGERAGNASLEQCAVAFELLHSIDTGLDLSQLCALSDLVAGYANMPVAPNTAIVGSNCFRHESGIHVAAISREPSCYEPFDPALVGAVRQLVLGKSSGRKAVRQLVGPAGQDLSDGAVRRILDELKVRSESGERLTEKVIEDMVARCRD